MFLMKFINLILCKRKDFFGLAPLKSRIFNKFPLLTTFKYSIFIDILFGIFYLAMGIILQGNFLFLGIIHGIYLFINVTVFNHYFYFDCYQILIIYLFKLYIVFAFQILFYFISEDRLYLMYNVSKIDNLDLIFIIIKTTQDLTISYVTWSLYRRIEMLRKNEKVD